MRHLFLLLAVPLLSSYLANAQDAIKTREIGLTTANLNDFGITYRFGNEKALWRFNAISTSLGQNNSSSDNFNFTVSTFGIGVQAGKEWRALLNEKLEMRYGFDLGFTYNYNISESYDKAIPDQISKSISNSYGTGINAVIGFNFVFAKGFLLGGDIQPGFFYNSSKRESYDPGVQDPRTINDNSFIFNINSNILRLSLLYRF